MTNDQQKDLGKAFFEAVKENNIKLVEEIIKKIENINAVGEHGWTTLIHACEGKEIVEMLIKCGVDINVASKYGWTALMKASNNGRKEIVEMLIKHGALINAADKFGETALMLASSCGRKEIVEILTINKADINAVDEYGYTALMYASLYEHKEVVKFLVEVGSNIIIDDFNVMIKEYLESITTSAKQRRISYLNNLTRDSMMDF